MKLLTVEKIHKIDSEIKDKIEYEFEILESGLYLIEIIASAKSWWQNLKELRSFFNDDDLAIKIDDIEFPKLNSKRGLFDAEAAWNGNNLKGLKKTNIFVMRLEFGKRKIEFIADKNPYLESIKISKAGSENYAIYTPSEENQQAQDGNNRQWINLVFADLPIKEIAITAKAEKRKKDSDDIKLIIDGEIQKNSDSKKFKNWYWCGSSDEGKGKEFNKQVNLTKGFHYIELYADRMPILSKVKIILKTEENLPPQEPEKRVPSVDDPEWTGDFNDDTEQMILARAIFGEARGLSRKGRIAIGWVIKNRINDSRWTDNYHGVILQPKQFSAFNEYDKNFKFVKNPFINKTQINEWYECYEVAGKVIKGNLNDPTDGANHYFSNFITAPDWTKNAEFKVQIGNTLFYDLKSEKENGSVKIFLLFLILLVAFVILNLFIIVIKIRSDHEDDYVELYRKTKNVIFKHYFIHPKDNNVGVIHFDGSGTILDIETIISNDYSKDQLKIFSDGEMFGYFQELHDKNKVYNFNSDYEKEQYYNDYVALKIVKHEFADPIEVYRGDVHTSNWEWADNKHVIVYYGCGTECLYAYKINIENKKIELEYYVYGGDENKK